MGHDLANYANYKDLISSKETVSTVVGPESGTIDLRNRKVLSMSPPRNINYRNLPPLLTSNKDGTVVFNQNYGKNQDPYGFGSSSARGGYIKPVVKKFHIF